MGFKKAIFTLIEVTNDENYYQLDNELKKKIEAIIKKENDKWKQKNLMKT